jgi:hypothetical protein
MEISQKRWLVYFMENPIIFSMDDHSENQMENWGSPMDWKPPYNRWLF